MISLATCPITIDESDNEKASQHNYSDPVAQLEIIPVSLCIPSPPSSDACMFEFTSSAFESSPRIQATSTPIPSPDH